MMKVFSMTLLKRFVKFSLCIMTVFLTGCATTSSTCNLTSDGKCGEVPERETVYGYPLHGYEGSPIRSSEHVQQIWIGPFEDTDGNFHEPSYVYKVIKQGDWVGEPVKAIND